MIESPLNFLKAKSCFKTYLRMRKIEKCLSQETSPTTKFCKFFKSNFPSEDGVTVDNSCGNHALNSSCGSQKFNGLPS